MTHDLQVLQEDIGFLKALAQPDPARRRKEGRILFAAGLIFGLASLGQWAIAAGIAPMSGWASNYLMWAVALIIYAATMLALGVRSGPRATDAGSRASAMAWTAVGCSIFFIFACLELVVWRTHSFTPLAMIPSMILALYGAAWMVAAAVSRARWAAVASAGSYAAALGSAWLCTTNAAYLWYAAALFLLLALPGAVMMRGARAGA